MPGTESNRDWGRWILAIGAALLLVWITFFDSHSLIKRARWHHEHAVLQEENERLRQEIAMLEARLEEGISDEVIERIAREQYGMRRPGETVYRVK